MTKMMAKTEPIVGSRADRPGFICSEKTHFCRESYNYIKLSPRSTRDYSSRLHQRRTYYRTSIMKLILLSALVAVLVCAIDARARPRYVAVPVQRLQLVEVADESAGYPLTRAVRRAGDDDGGDGDDDGGRFQRGAHGGGDGHDHVDYGAHTGHHGAFGWYADFPVHVGH